MLAQDFDSGTSVEAFLAEMPETSYDGLTLDTRLAELPLHRVQLDMSSTGESVLHAFADPLLPGIILSEDGVYKSMLSRRRFLEVMNQRYGKDLFSRRSLHSLLRYAKPADEQYWHASTPVVQAATQCLLRGHEFREEPLVVRDDDGAYQVLDLNLLLVSHAKIHQLATRMLEHQFQVQKYALSLEHKNAELERLNQLKDQFLANTSHELRTPLNGIIGIAGSLLDGSLGQLSEPQRTNLQVVLHSGQRLASLVNDILDFSKLKHRNLELQSRPLDLKTVVEEVLTLVKVLTRNKPLQLLNAVPADLAPVYADPNRLQQILHNLVGNAVKFTAAGRITVSAKTEQGRVWLHVRDTGIGIAEDQLERIFEAFEQGDGSVARQYGGTGLGLSITRSLVELHGGQLRASSQPGHGSCFSFDLPLAEDAELYAQPGLLRPVPEAAAHTALYAPLDLPAPEPRSHPLPANAPRLLIVDDEAVNHQVFLNQLAQQDYALSQALSGPEALDLIKDGPLPDLVLLDVMMPGMSGYEVLRQLRERYGADQLPVLLVTAKNQVSDLVMGLEFGANDYLSKPVAKQELLARIRTHLNLKQLKNENLRMSAELEVTRRLQQMLLPREQEMQHAELDLAGFMQAAEEVGGDYYDVLHDHHSGGLKVGIGDVTGHGLESGVVAIMVQTAIRTLLAHNETDPVKFLNTLNRTIYHNVRRMGSDKNLTLSLLDYRGDGQVCVSGQHEEIIVVRADRQVERIDTINLGFFIGMEEDIAAFIDGHAIQLQPGDGIVLYTDGITEASNPQGQRYEVERLCQLLQDHWHRDAANLRRLVIEDVSSHLGGHKIQDDLTLVVMKRKPVSQTQPMVSHPRPNRAPALLN